MLRSSFVRVPALILVLACLCTLPARAESKEMIQLMEQVRQLQEAVARLQQSNDERMGVMKELVQQTADSVNQMSVQVNGMKLAAQNQQDASTAKNDQFSGQVQSLNDSLDELKARMARMEKVLGDIKNEQQSANAVLNNLPQAGAPSATNSGTPPPSDTPPPAPSAPPVADMYRTAYKDYIAAKYPLAAGEFADLTKAYPDDDLSGNAFFYIGEIDLRTQKAPAAIKNYDQLLERYPDNPKVPAAHLHKAQALLLAKQNDAAVREMRALIQRFPASPEAAQARLKLASMHVPVAAQ